MERRYIVAAIKLVAYMKLHAAIVSFKRYFWMILQFAHLRRSADWMTFFCFKSTLYQTYAMSNKYIFGFPWLMITFPKLKIWSLQHLCVNHIFINYFRNMIFSVLKLFISSIPTRCHTPYGFLWLMTTSPKSSGNFNNYIY